MSEPTPTPAPGPQTFSPKVSYPTNDGERNHGDQPASLSEITMRQLAAELATSNLKLVELEQTNKTLHNLMVSGERRGAEKAEQELAALKLKLEVAKRALISIASLQLEGRAWPVTCMANLALAQLNESK